MLSLDLFSSRFEKELHEGAVDNLEARRIDDLNMRMLELLDRAKEPAYRKNPGALAGLKRQFQKIKAERDSYFKINPATGMNDSGTLGTTKGRLDDGQVTPTATGLRHHAKPGVYGGFEKEKDPLAKLDKGTTNSLEKSMGIKFNREKKYQGGLDVDEGGIPGNVPVEKIPGKEDLLKGKGRSYYEDQKKNLNLSKGIIPTEPLPEHGGGIGPKQRWQDLMPEQMNPEDYDDYEDEDEDLRLRSGDYVRDQQDGESGEIFRMQGDPEERRVRILDRDGRGWYIEPSRLTRVDPQDPDVQRYFGKQRVRDMDEGQFSINNDPQAHAKILFLKTINGNEYRLVKQGDTYKIYVNRSRKNKQEFPSFDLAKKALQQLLLNAVHTDEQGVAEGWSDAVVARRTGTPRTPYSVYIKGKKWKDFETDDHAEAVANKLRARFKAEGRDPSVITIAPTDIPAVKEDQDTSGVESAIIRRIMVAHTDLLRQFGPDKVMQAAEEVAYNVGDVDEIGTSDVSAYVDQVKQILGADA